MSWEIRIDIHTLLRIKQIASGEPASRELSSVLCGDLEGWDCWWGAVLEGGDIHIHTGDSLCCTAETNTML